MKKRYVSVRKKMIEKMRGQNLGKKETQKIEKRRGGGFIALKV